MEYTVLGRTGLRVSRLGLGGAPLAGDFGSADPREVEAMIHEALDLGVNVIDTAPRYGGGESERRIGRALRGRRNAVILATKAAGHNQTYDYETVTRSVEDSLRRLQTDWVDLLQLHDVDSQPYELLMEEALPALERLREQGKVRYIGISGRNLALLMRYMRTGRYDTVQFYARYMLIDHTAKDALLPLAAETGMGVINGSVLGLGMLADRPAPFVERDVVGEAERRMEKLAFLRRPPGAPGGLVEPGMRFSLSEPRIHVTLTGAESRSVLRMNAAFCDGRGLDPADLRRIYALFDGQPLFDP